MIGPLGVYVIVFAIAKWISKDHKRSVSIAVFFAAPCTIGAVYFTMLSIWDVSLLWLILILMAFIGVITSFFLWKRDQDMHWVRINKGFWRLNFVVFLIAHVLLMLYGLIEAVYVAISI